MLVYFLIFVSQLSTLSCYLQAIADDRQWKLFWGSNTRNATVISTNGKKINSAYLSLTVFSVSEKLIVHSRQHYSIFKNYNQPGKLSEWPARWTCLVYTNGCFYPFNPFWDNIYIWMLMPMPMLMPRCRCQDFQVAFGVYFSPHQRNILYKLQRKPIMK